MAIHCVDKRYQEKKKIAKEYYLKIGRVWCPILRDYIAFNQMGFRHMIRKERKPRPQNDQIRKFAFLQLVKDVIESKEVSLIREENMKTSAPWNFLAISEKKNKQIIVVIIRQNRTGYKHFFSVYNQKIA